MDITDLNRSPKYGVLWFCELAFSASEARSGPPRHPTGRCGILEVGSGDLLLHGRGRGFGVAGI
jgi:hypothetical protein